MEVIHERCAGLDVHKKTVVVCQMHTRAHGRKEQETRTFGTTTVELLAVLDWLAEWGCTHVAMESTGEYWKPVYNILEGHVEVLLVNAQHIKAVPGRKTDIGDAEWIADLLRHGLLRSSFVPPRAQRELRDLTRQRSNLVRERASVINRLQKVLEAANVKLASVVSHVAGASARAMLEAMISGESDPAALAELAKGRMRGKRAELERALAGTTGAHHRFLLATHLEHIDFLDEQIESYSAQIAIHLDRLTSEADLNSGPPPSPSAAPDDPVSATPQPDGGVSHPLTGVQAVVLLDTIPGIGPWQAEVILAEIGLDMTRFATAAHLASWAGVAPGNNESAGKRRPGKTRHGNPALCKTLVQAAHAAARTKNTYLAAQYRRLAARRGANRAAVAVAHSILVIAHHLLTRREPYQDLGGNYFDERKRDSVTHRLVRRLEKLGHHVTLDAASATTGA
jgi:transposase